RWWRRVQANERVLMAQRRAVLAFFFSSRRRHTRFSRDWSSDVCSSDLVDQVTRSLATIADGGGDLTRRLPTDSQNEIAALAHNFNRVMEHIASIIRNVVQVNDKVRINVNTMSSATESTVNSTSQQLREIELV